jgi:hypothetical protein
MIAVVGVAFKPADSRYKVGDTATDFKLYYWLITKLQKII